MLIVVSIWVVLFYFSFPLPLHRTLWSWTAIVPFDWVISIIILSLISGVIPFWTYIPRIWIFKSFLSIFYSLIIRNRPIFEIYVIDSLILPFTLFMVFAPLIWLVPIIVLGGFSPIWVFVSILILFLFLIIVHSRRWTIFLLGAVTLVATLSITVILLFFVSYLGFGRVLWVGVIGVSGSLISYLTTTLQVHLSIFGIWIRWYTWSWWLISLILCNRW